MLTGNEAVALLVELHELEDRLATLKRRGSGPVPTKIQSLRHQLPDQVLHHHDRMRSRGKRSIAPVRHWVCSGCFIAVPIGDRAGLQSGKDLHLCQTCGRFFYMTVEEVAAATEAQAQPLPAGKGRMANRMVNQPILSSLDAPTPPKKRKPMKVARLVH